MERTDGMNGSSGQIRQSGMMGESLKIILDGRNCRGRVISSPEGYLLISDQ